jgi:Protein of unknown function (DUF3667)
MQQPTVTCKSCGNHFQGKFCNQCGEKVYRAHDKKLSHFFEEAFHFITHFDNKFFRSFWLMLAKPGYVAKEYSEGKRKKYFSPVSLFLIGIVIYLIFPLLQGMNISFANHLNNNRQLHFYAIQNWAEHKAAAKHMTLEQLAEKFDHVSPKFSKVLLIVLIPLTALILALLFRRKNLYYFDHLMMAAEFNSFYLYFNFLILPSLILLFAKITRFNLDYGESIFTFSLLGAIILIVIALGFRRFYQVRFVTGLLKGILFMIMFILMIHIYRIILYSVVMLFI